MNEALSAELERNRKILAPLFSHSGVDIFEYACSLLRVGGMQDAGWDPLQESVELFADLMTLSEGLLEDDPGNRFRDREKTVIRLALISYGHLTEMDAPYHLLANLLRVRARMRYVTDPFPSLTRRNSKKRRPNPFREIPPPTPTSKIRIIKELALQAHLPEVGSAFDDFYLPSLRHAIAHSDYILHKQEFRMLHGHIAEESNPRSLSPVISLERLTKIINRTYGFYAALFLLEKGARQSFANLRGKCFPYDPHYKGLLEFLIDGDAMLCGFKVHWPNGQDSIYRRTAHGCEALNLAWDPDGGINFFVGEYPQPPDPFSPLVTLGGEPRYTPPEGSTAPPRWPSRMNNT